MGIAAIINRNDTASAETIALDHGIGEADTLPQLGKIQ
jgi:hypothetical protein